VDPISVAVRRGEVAESRHRVHAVAVREGRIVDAAGDAALVTFMRSFAEPFQALPLVRACPELSDDEVAVACASHEALPEPSRPCAFPLWQRSSCRTAEERAWESSSPSVAVRR
jgi:L-asparaginase II